MDSDKNQAVTDFDDDPVTVVTERDSMHGLIYGECTRKYHESLKFTEQGFRDAMGPVTPWEGCGLLGTCPRCGSTLALRTEEIDK